MIFLGQKVPISKDSWVGWLWSDQIWKFESWGDVPICLNSGSNDHNFETCGQKVSI